MTDYGYIPLSRKMVDGHDPVWETDEPFDCRSAWIDLLFFARFAPGISEGETLERGEFLASVRFLATRWGWGRGTVHDFLSTLQKLGRITERRAGHRGTVYGVVNYEEYNPLEGKPRTPRRTPKGTTSGQPPDKDKEGLKNEVSALDVLVAEGCVIWKAEMGGPLNFGRLKKAWKALTPEHPDETILGHWREYFRRNQRESDRAYLTPEGFVAKFGLYTPPGQLTVLQGGQDTEERYAFLVGEAQRLMDMSDTKKYPDWPLYRDRYRRGDKPKVSRGTLRPTG